MPISSARMPPCTSECSCEDIHASPSFWYGSRGIKRSSLGSFLSVHTFLTNRSGSRGFASSSSSSPYSCLVLLSLFLISSSLHFLYNFTLSFWYSPSVHFFTFNLSMLLSLMWSISSLKPPSDNLLILSPLPVQARQSRPFPLFWTIDLSLKPKAITTYFK